jgi:hypothetical protein
MSITRILVIQHLGYVGDVAGFQLEDIFVSQMIYAIGHHVPFIAIWKLSLPMDGTMKVV